MKSVEPSHQGFLEVLQPRKELVVSDGPLGFSPEILDGIKFRRVSRQEMEFNEIFLAFNPFPNLWRFVIWGVVRDKVNLDATVVAKKLIQKLNKRLGVEHTDEPGMPFGLCTDSDGSHNFDAFPNRWSQHLHPNADECPCPDDGAGLLKYSFVLIEHYAPFLFRFFLIAGSSSIRHVCWAFLSAFDNVLPGYCTENRSP